MGWRLEGVESAPDNDLVLGYELELKELDWRKRLAGWRGKPANGPDITTYEGYDICAALGL